MELIDKQAVIDAIVSGTIYETAEAIKKECQNPSSDNDWIGGINDAINTVEDINGIELVRCKDCVWGLKERNGKGEDVIECQNSYLFDAPLCLPYDFFCADGERKES